MLKLSCMSTNLPRMSTYLIKKNDLHTRGRSMPPFYTGEDKEFKQRASVTKNFDHFFNVKFWDQRCWKKKPSPLIIDPHPGILIMKPVLNSIPNTCVNEHQWIDIHIFDVFDQKCTFLSYLFFRYEYLHIERLKFFKTVSPKHDTF